MLPLAHIGNIPVEEYAPFVAPVIALYVYARVRHRRERKVLARLPGLDALDERTVERVLAHWAADGHEHASRELLPLIYPPGPDGATCNELAGRLDADPTSVRDRLEQLADLGYLEIDGDAEDDDPRCWLTLEGINLLNVTEETLLDTARDGSR